MVNATVQQNMPQFYADATSSSWFDLLSEYSSVPAGSQTTGQSIGRGTSYDAGTGTRTARR
jgi:hypothetical protein